ncbi:MAG: HAD family hydrolase, partial [Ardenticatenaceae bacterium]
DLFHHVAEHFGVAAGRALHVGDNPYADVLGARAAGWQCVLIDPDDLFPDWDVPRLRTLRDLPNALARWRVGALAR